MLRGAVDAGRALLSIRKQKTWLSELEKPGYAQFTGFKTIKYGLTELKF